MFENIDEIILLNTKLSEKVRDSIEEITVSLSKSKFKKTSRVLLSYIPRAGYINNSIINCYLSNDPYSAGILFRPMIEHAFRQLYIYSRALNENSDTVGEDYYGKLKGSEDLAYFKKVNSYNKYYNKVVNSNKTIWNLEGDHNNLIKDVGDKFNITRIFHYLIEKFPKDKPYIIDGMNDYILERIQQYSSFSSSVHGGPYAEMVLEKILTDKDEFKSQLKNLTMDSYYLYKSIIETAYLFAYLTDNKVQKYYQTIKNL